MPPLESIMSTGSARGILACRTRHRRSERFDCSSSRQREYRAMMVGVEESGTRTVERPALRPCRSAAKAAFAALDAGGGAAVEQPDTDTRVANIARHFASCHIGTAPGRWCSIRPPTVASASPMPSASSWWRRHPRGRGRHRGRPGVARPHPRPAPGPSVQSATHPGISSRSVKPPRASRDPASATGYRIDSVDARAGTIRLVPPKGKPHDWQPAHWAAIMPRRSRRSAKSFGPARQGAVHPQQQSRESAKRRDRDGGGDRRGWIERRCREG